MQIYRRLGVALYSNDGTYSKLAHARGAYHNRACTFQDVAIAQSDGSEGHCQLRMLFTIKSAIGEEHELAFVRMYAPATHPTAAAAYHNSLMVKWAEVRAPRDCPADAYGRRLLPRSGNNAAAIPAYSIISIHAISGFALLHPSSWDGKWFVNRYIRCKA